MDWDQDGNTDILSGCYWTDGADGGHIQILKGTDAKLDFEKATALLSGAGKPLENVKLDKGDDDNGMNPDQTKNICTQQHAVDYDGDGDLDLVVGCFANNFFYYENKSENGKNVLAETPVQMDLVSPDYHAAPHLVDFDGDGDLDFLTGGASGGVYIAMNEGTREKPKYGDFQTLIAKPKDPYEGQNPDAISMSGGTRIWATDFNGDGLMDLLVGDHVTISKPKDGISMKEFARKKAETKKKMARFFARRQFLEEAGRTMKPSDEEAWGKEMTKVYSESREYENSESTGFVWLLLKKPITGKDVTQN